MPNDSTQPALHRTELQLFPNSDADRLALSAPSPITTSHPRLYFSDATEQTADIVLCTFNAKYHHTAFGLRYLLANAQEFQNAIVTVERTIHDDPTLTIEHLLALKPQFVGFSVYIWNRDITLKTISILKKLHPEIIVCVGGPEVSYENEDLQSNPSIDFIISGEGEHNLPELLRRLSGQGSDDGQMALETQKHWSEQKPDIGVFNLPYRFYSDEDLAHRAIYVEASRGCPYECSFCLSSLEEKVRNIPLDRFYAEMSSLYERGARQFKFIDRTFNLKPSISVGIMDFFLDRYDNDMFLHFEVVPDRLPEKLRSRISQFPKAALQFEIGIQTLTPHVMERIHRKQNLEKTEANFKFLTEETGAYIHADLIAGLPGESWNEFEDSFNRLFQMGPHEIQMGILKRLKGSPITQLESAFELKFDPETPFSVLSTSTMSFQEIQKIKRMAKTWDQIWNQQQFPLTMQLMFAHAQSAFQTLADFDAILHHKVPDAYPRHAVNLQRLAEILFSYITEQLGHDKADTLKALLTDFCVVVDRPAPKFIGASDELALIAKGIQLPTFSRRADFSHIPERQRRWAIASELS